MIEGGAAENSYSEIFYSESSHKNNFGGSDFTDHWWLPGNLLRFTKSIFFTHLQVSTFKRKVMWQLYVTVCHLNFRNAVLKGFEKIFTKSL